VPKGAKIRRIGAQIVVEDTMESIVNRITELEGRIQSLEAKNADMEQQITNLNERAAKNNVFYDSSAGAGRS
jgi:prefoldin subunit 5